VTTHHFEPRNRAEQEMIEHLDGEAAKLHGGVYQNFLDTLDLRKAYELDLSRRVSTMKADGKNYNDLINLYMSFIVNVANSLMLNLFEINNPAVQEAVASNIAQHLYEHIATDDLGDRSSIFAVKISGNQHDS
jgi:hypothetical protein